MDKNKIIDKAIKLTSALDAHLSEKDCKHTIKEIAQEALADED